MADEVVEPKPADASLTPPPNPTTDPPKPATGGEIEPWRNPAEIKKMMIRQREMETKMAELENKVAPPAPPKTEGTPRDVGAELDALRQDLELERAFGALKIESGSKQRQLLELAVKAAKPANVREFLQGFVETTAPVAPPAAEKPKVPVTNSGSPTTQDDAAVVGNSPAALTPAMIKAMSPEQLKAHYEAYVGSQSPNTNPFSRKAAPKGVDLGATLRAALESTKT
jgi:hypothetical protein